MGNTFRAICLGKLIVTKSSAGDSFKNFLATNRVWLSNAGVGRLAVKPPTSGSDVSSNGGVGGLGNQRRLARRIHNRPGEVWLRRIRRWRRQHPRWGAPKLHWALLRHFGRRGLPSEAAIGRWLKGWALTRKPRRSAHKGPLAERPRLTQARRPNDVWTVDFKGCFRTGDGTRIEPLIVRDLASRYVLAVVLFRRQSILECLPAFERMFRQYGLPRVIRADNGSPFGQRGPWD